MSESETTKPAANEFGRCGLEVRDVMAAAMQNHCQDLDVMNWQHSILADAIDRIAANVAEVNRSVREELDGVAADVRAMNPSVRKELDRIAADVAKIKAKVDSIEPEDVLHFVEAEKAWVSLVEEQRDAAIRERDEARAEVERLRAELAARPAAGWLSEDECWKLRVAVEHLKRLGSETAETIDAILARAGSPPVVEVPALKFLGPMTGREQGIVLAYRDALDSAGIPWKEKGVPRE